MLKRRILVLTMSAAAAVCLTLAGCGQGSGGSGTGTAAPTTARNQAADVVAADAIIVPARGARLSFKTGGQVLQVLVSEGDTVTAGQALVRLDARDLEQVVRRAEAELKSAEAAAAKAKAGARAEEIAASEATLGIAQARVKAAQRAVAVAQGNLAAAQAQVKTVESGVEIAQGNLTAAQATAQNAQANLDKLVTGPTPREIQIAEKQLEQAKNLLWGLQRLKQGTVDAAETTVKIAQLQLERVKAGSRTEDIAIAKSQVAEAVSAVQTAQGQVTRAQSQVAQAKARVPIAESQVAQAKSQVASAQAQTEQARAQLDMVKAGTRSEDIAIAAAAVARAGSALARARNSLADATLKAPFQGTIGTLLINEGEEASPQTPVLTLGDLSRWRVQTEDLGEADVARVSLGQEVVVTVDALAGAKFRGKITEIALVASDSRGDKVYTVIADLDSRAGSGLRWGMSAFLESVMR